MSQHTMMNLEIATIFSMGEEARHTSGEYRGLLNSGTHPRSASQHALEFGEWYGNVMSRCDSIKDLMWNMRTSIRCSSAPAPDGAKMSHLERIPLPNFAG